MKHPLFAAMLVAVLTIAFSAATFSQDAAMKKAPTTEMKSTGKLMSVSCDPSCGFVVKSHDQKELVAIVKSHAKTHHNKDVTDKDVMAMMKTEDMKAETKTK